MDEQIERQIRAEIENCNLAIQESIKTENFSEIANRAMIRSTLEWVLSLA